MTIERTPTQKAYSLIDAISDQTHRVGLFDDVFMADLQEALYTLSEGLDVTISADDATMVWQLIQYLAENKLKDEHKL